MSAARVADLIADLIADSSSECRMGHTESCGLLGEPLEAKELEQLCVNFRPMERGRRRRPS